MPLQTSRARFMPLKLGEREMHAASKTLRARFMPLQTRKRDACRYRFFRRHAFRSLTLKAASISKLRAGCMHPAINKSEKIENAMHATKARKVPCISHTTFKLSERDSCRPKPHERDACRRNFDSGMNRNLYS